MRISSVRIRNFRTISDLEINLDTCVAICGPNSCGKSNILAAIQFAFDPQVDKERILANLPRSKRDLHGGPRLSIYVDIEFTDVSHELAAIAKAKAGSTVTYRFRAIRSGNVSRVLGAETLDTVDPLLECFKVIYVPPIRDLATGGLEPFREVFADALRKARGTSSMNTVLRSAKRVLEERGRRVLESQREVAESLLGAHRLEISTEGVSIDDLYKAVQLTVADDTGSKPLSELGTGHQSAVIVHLYRQLAEQSAATILLLLEEPDNHLHPATIRAVAEDILELAASYQVVVTTHSPIFLEAVGLENVLPIIANENGETAARELDLSEYKARDVRRLLQQFNLRITEPLLANRVIIVEGAFDAAVISALIESKTGSRPSDNGVLVIVGGGKDGVVTLAEFVDSCGVDWTAVVDLDAAFSPELPRVKDGITPTEKADALRAAATLETVLDLTFKRGRQVQKAIASIVDELRKGRPAAKAFDGSHLERLTKVAGITATDATHIKQDLAAGRYSRAARLLREYEIILWSGELEEILLRNSNSETVAESVLIKEGILRAPLTTDRRENIIGMIRNLANEPDTLSKIVHELNRKRLFNRSEINQACSVLIN